MHKGDQRPALVRVPQDLPIGIVAEITSGIARQPRRKRAWPHRSEKSREWRMAATRSRLTCRDDAGRRTMSGCIGKQHRDGVAGARFDAKLVATPSETEYQHDVGLGREQFGQIAIDGRIGRSKDMRGACDAGQSGAPPAGERLDQQRARVEWRTGEWAEAGNEDAHPVTRRAARRFPQPPIPAPGGRRRHRPQCAAAPP